VVRRHDVLDGGTGDFFEVFCQKKGHTCRSTGGSEVQLSAGIFVPMADDHVAKAPEIVEQEPKV
jgi:hypothetical protein